MGTKNRFLLVRLFHLLVAVLLLVAAVMKARQLAAEPLPKDALVTNRWLLAAVLEWEVMLAAWLCSGGALRGANVAAAITFALFCAVALYEAAQGHASCGCFGRVTIDPRITAGLDLIVLTGLILARPGRNSAHQIEKPPYLPMRVAFVAIAALGLGAWVAVGVARYR